MPMSFKIIGVGLILILVGFFSSLTSLRLSFFGKKTKADLMEAWAKFDKNSDEMVSNIELKYRFIDDKGEQIYGGTRVPKDYRPPEDGKVEVVYISGSSKNNRLASASSWSGYLIFIAGIVVTVIGVVYFNNESVNEAHAETAATMDRAHKRSLQGRIGL
jgi:hypothetical protein